VTPGENLDRRRLQAILQAGRELAAIDFQTLQISKLDKASSFLQNCMAATICPDGIDSYSIQSHYESTLKQYYFQVKQYTESIGLVYFLL